MYPPLRTTGEALSRDSSPSSSQKNVDHSFPNYKMNLLDKIILKSLFSIEISWPGEKKIVHSLILLFILDTDTSHSILLGSGPSGVQE